MFGSAERNSLAQNGNCLHGTVYTKPWKWIHTLFGIRQNLVKSYWIIYFQVFTEKVLIYN